VIKIKAIILAAGYATRLHPLTENQPKPLLNVGDKPIIEHITDKIQHVKEIDEILIITNHKFYPMFNSWLNEYPTKKRIKIINDGTLSNEDRLGAVGDLHFTIQEEGITSDVLLIAGDNLFGFSLRDFHSYFKQKNNTVIAFHDLKEKAKVANKFGVGIIDQDKKIINFEEKPAQPPTTLASTCCYILSKKDLKQIPQYIKESERWDNPGDFANWLKERSEVYGYVFEEHWFDIGSFEGLEEANKFYETK